MTSTNQSSIDPVLVQISHYMQLGQQANARTALTNLITERLIEELLGADDQIRLHDKVTGDYQDWFTNRLAELKALQADSINTKGDKK